MQESQSYRNHARFDPPFHYFLAPVLLLNVIFWIAYLIHHWPLHWLLNGWLVIMAVALLMLAGVARNSALRAQDRVIRLEEKIRYLQLLSPETVAATQALSLKQIIALRFASDAELPVLVQRTVSENLEPKVIKQSITVWRADHQRV